MCEMTEIGLSFHSNGEKKNYKNHDRIFNVVRGIDANLLGMSTVMLGAVERAYPSWTPSWPPGVTKEFLSYSIT